MTFRSLRVPMFAALTTVMLSAGTGVARAQEGPIDHLRHRTHQIVRTVHHAFYHHHPRRVTVRRYDYRHHRYYYETYWR